MDDLYGKLFIQCFGEWIDHHVPDFVLLSVTDDDADIMGFLSCFQSKHNEVYVMWGGFREEYRGIGVRGKIKKARDYLHIQYNNIITTVENTNTTMLKLYLSLGYLIYGIKTSTDNHIYLELIHEKEQ